MMTLQTYMQGHRLYGETHTQYGPAFYLLTSPLHSLGWPLTQSGIRIKTAIFWIIAVWLCFSIVRRVSGSTTAGVATGLLAALQLDKLTLEPGHPQEVTLICTLGLLLLLVRSKYISIDASPNFLSFSSWLTVGFLAGMVGLVKMNCGLVIAIPLIVTGCIQLPFVRALRWGLVAMILSPAILVAWMARTDTVVTLWAIWIGICAALFLRSAIPNRSPFAFASMLPLTAIVTGGGIAIVVVLGLSMLQGISASELWQGMVGQHAQFGRIFFVPMGISFPAIVGLGTGIAALLCRTSSKLENFAKPILWLCVAFSIALTSPLALQHGLNPRGAGLLLAWAAPGWIVWLWRGEVASSPQKLCLGLIAILSPLIAFPVSGTQVALGTLPSLLVVGIFLGEFFGKHASTFSLNANRINDQSHSSFQRLVLAGTTLVFVASSLSHWSRYVNGVPLDLPGSYRMRLAPEVVTEQRAIVDAILKSRTPYLIFEGNNHNRFYFWTDLQPLTSANPTFWPLMLIEEEQQHLAEAIDRESRLCVVRVPQYDWLYQNHAVPIRQRLEARWRPTEAIGDWQIGIAE